MGPGASDNAATEPDWGTISSDDNGDSNFKFGNADNSPGDDAESDLHFDISTPPEMSTQRRVSKTRRPSLFTAYDDFTAIDWRRENLREMERQKNLAGAWARVWDTAQVWVVLALTGIMVGILAAGIDVATQWLSSIKLGRCSAGFYLSQSFCCWGHTSGTECADWIPWGSDSAGGYMGAYTIYVALTVTFAALASFFIVQFAPYARLSGVAEIKTVLGGFVMKGFLGAKTLVVKSIGLCLVVGAGIWAGKEGPLVHVAVCCSNVILSHFAGLRYRETKKREIFAAASAAGITVAFGAPIGGVVFALEAMAYYPNSRTMWHAFVCAMAASVTLESINPYRTGQIVLFQVVYDRNWHKFELIPFALLGVIGGLFGTAIIRLNRFFAQWRKHSPLASRHQLLEVVLVAAITGIISFPDIYLRLPFSVLLSHLFQECSESSVSGLCDVNHWFATFSLLIFAGLIGVVSSSYTFGINIPAGMLMPSVVTGALIGRGVGSAMQAWQENHPGFGLFASCAPEGVCVTPGVYALVGAASMLTGVTRLTVSCVVIMFELTGALNYVLPIMAGVMLSKWVADSLGRQGFYEMWIELLEYPLIPRTAQTVVPELTAQDVMTPAESIPILHTRGHTTTELLRVVETSDVSGFPVVTGSAPGSDGFVDSVKRTNDDEAESAGEVVGYMTRQDLKQALQLSTSSTAGDEPCLLSTTMPGERGVDLSEYLEIPQIMSVRTPLLVVAKTMQTLGLSYCLFADRGQFRGFMTIKDMWYCLRTSNTRYASESIDNMDVLDASQEASPEAGLLSSTRD